MKGKRKTLNASDVLSAMEEMEFQRFVTPLKEALEGIRPLFGFLSRRKDDHPLFPDGLDCSNPALGTIPLFSWYQLRYVIQAWLSFYALVCNNLLLPYSIQAGAKRQEGGFRAKEEGQRQKNRFRGAGQEQGGRR